jgi:uncharacterized protein YozE (UPF0346 family)
MSKTPKEFVKDKLNEKTGQGITLYEHYLAHDTTISIGTVVSWMEEYASLYQPTGKTDELISKLEELIEQYKAYYDSQQSPAVKIMPSWMEYNNQLESEISELKEQIKKEETLPSEQKLRLSAEPYLTFHGKFNLSLADCDEMVEFIFSTLGA